jgi:hypothetical protein
VPGIGVIGRVFLGDAVGRQAEQVTEAQDAENDREWPPPGGPDGGRDRQAGECGGGGDVEGQGSRRQAELLLPLIRAGAGQGRPRRLPCPQLEEEPRPATTIATRLTHSHQYRPPRITHAAANTFPAPTIHAGLRHRGRMKLLT